MAKKFNPSAIIGKELYETLREDETNTPVMEYGTVQSIKKVDYMPSTYFLVCSKSKLYLSTLQVACVLEKGVYHGIKKYLRMK